MRNLIATATLSLIFLGCLEFDILIKVNRDGSGTLEQTVLMKKELVKQMEELAGSFGGSQNKFKLIDKKKLIKDAATMGKGVYFQYVKPISEKDREGYIAYYSFKDINMLKINQNPSDKISPPGDGEVKAPLEELTFSFQPGNPSTLTVMQPKMTFTPDTTTECTQESPTAADDTSGLYMMLEMMNGLRMSVALHINGSIRKTNSSYIKGNRVTIMEVDFEQLIRDRTKFLEISKQKPQTMEEAKKFLKDIPGIKCETAEKITVEF